MRRLHFEQGRTRTEVAKLLQRSLSSVSLLLAQKKAPKAVGWPSSLSAARVDRVAALLENMVDEADGNYKVTMAMVLRRGAAQRVREDARHCHAGAWLSHQEPATSVSLSMRSRKKGVRRDRYSGGLSRGCVVAPIATRVDVAWGEGLVSVWPGSIQHIYVVRNFTATLLSVRVPGMVPMESSIRTVFAQ